MLSGRKGDLDRFLNFDTVGDIAFAAAQKVGLRF